MSIDEYNHCVDAHADAVYRFILKHLGDSEKARDTVQESFAKMWINVPQIAADKAKSYLFSTAYHTMIDLLRRERKMSRLEPTHTRQLSHSEQYSDLNEVLHQALDTLPEIQKSVVLLRDYEGYSYHEIGEICSLSEAQVKVYIFRARKALRDYLIRVEAVL